MRNLFLFLIGTGCAQGTSIDPEVVLPNTVSASPEPECGMAFDPDPELLEATEAATSRWSEATGGCDIRTEDEGIPLIAWPALFVEYSSNGEALLSNINYSGDLRSICGLATWNDEATEVVRLDISLACDVVDAVTHEIGHALARLKRHSFTGVMASGENKNRTKVIDDSSLELVCYNFNCSEMRPE